MTGNRGGDLAVNHRSVVSVEQVFVIQPLVCLLFFCSAHLRQFDVLKQFTDKLVGVPGQGFIVG